MVTALKFAADNPRPKNIKFFNRVINESNVNPKKKTVGLHSLFKKKPKKLIFFGPVIMDYPAKLRALARDPLVLDLLREADSLVGQQLGWSVLARLENERLSSTFVHEDYLIHECLYQFCLFEKLKSEIFEYDLVAGFSIGEIASQLAAGCFSFTEAVLISCAIAEAVRSPRHADLIIVFAPPADVEPLLAVNKITCFLAINNGNRSVWSGLVSELKRLEEALKITSTKSQRLFFDCAIHSPLTDAGLLEKRLSWLNPRKAACPSYSSTVGGLLCNSPDSSHWIRLITQPSLTNEMLKALKKPGYNQIISIASLRTRADERALLSRAAPGTTLCDGAELLGMVE